MFHLQPIRDDHDELVFDNPSCLSKRKKILDDDHAFMATNILNFPTNNQLSCFPERQTDSKNDTCIIRKVLHRDIERKRRQNMSQLYASLRALLPLEHIKGKRSVSDHMHEATNYIKSEHKKIQELKIHRDKLKNLSNGGGNLSNCNVVLNRVHYGVEILISSDCELWLSKVVAELLERGLNVFSCVSTSAKERFLHKIQAEASDTASLDDLSVLQERLTNIMSYSGLAR
ncbi:hypothetical protein CASFOL_008379 [Castilleja foliolosa]|uniref:BHLH domain-containing protein n=1 Tax=Castilleja foliolosa TaxID=1961234 RepID=A0ABD3E2U7_9LAMI